MHNSSLLRMNWFLEEFVFQDVISDQKIKVLDVGSYDYNGSYKSLFEEGKVEYYGLDLEKGPNVDIVVNSPYSWPEIESEKFDIVISGQAFEHNEFFWLTLEEIARVLKPQGKLCIIAPNGFQEHRFPVDCYRFFTDGMIALARYIEFDVLHASTNAAPHSQHDTWCKPGEEDAILIAQKNYSGGARTIHKESYKLKPAEHDKFLSGLINLPNQKENGLQKFIMKLYRKAAFFSKS